MFYRYNKDTLEFERVNWIALTIKASAVAVVLLSGLGLTIHEKDKVRTESEIMVIMSQHDKFTNDKLVGLIKTMNFRFPHIVYAQSILETKDFQSNIFKENHNLFGMKQAVVRITTSLGTQYGHSIYANWMKSLDDYALYTSNYLSDLKTENEYFDYLAQNYAEDKQYVSKLKNLIASRNLKSKFN